MRGREYSALCLALLTYTLLCSLLSTGTALLTYMLLCSPRSLFSVPLYVQKAWGMVKSFCLVASQQKLSLAWWVQVQGRKGGKGWEGGEGGKGGEGGEGGKSGKGAIFQSIGCITDAGPSMSMYPGGGMWEILRQKRKVSTDVRRSNLVSQVLQSLLCSLSTD